MFNARLVRVNENHIPRKSEMLTDLEIDDTRHWHFIRRFLLCLTVPNISIDFIARHEKYYDKKSEKTQQATYRIKPSLPVF